jgi:hypothetical protein
METRDDFKAHLLNLNRMLNASSLVGKNEGYELLGMAPRTMDFLIDRSLLGLTLGN